MHRSCTSSSEPSRASEPAIGSESTSGSDATGWSRARHCAVAWGVTLCLLIGAETALRVHGEELFAREARSFDGHFHTVEREVLRRGAPPEVLVMGDSRAMVAVLPRRLEAELQHSGVRGRVANLGLSSGTPFDMWKLLERNPDVLEDVRVIVYFVDAEAWTAPGRVASLGSLSEQLAARGSDALLPALFQSFAARAQILELVQDRYRGEPGSRLELDHQGRAVDFEVSPRGPEQYAKVAAGRRATGLLSDYAPRRHQLDSFLRIASWCAERGSELLLLQLPTRPEYDAAVAERHPEVAPAYRAVLAELAERGLPVRRLTRGMLELAPHDFHDADHLADSGAEKSTRFVADEIASMFAPDFAPVGPPAPVY